jgi:hypothetical protein
MFEGGKGKIVACVVANHAIPGYAPSCGYKVSVQRLDQNWKPTSDDPIDEFLNAGPTTDEKTGEPKFHPGKASSSDDTNPEVDVGRSLDCGGADGAEGTCLLTASGKGPDKKSKLTHFTNSAIGAGVKPHLFNGYAPNLVGLEAEFSKFMMEKPPNSTSKNNPTALIIGTGGKPGGPECVHKYPDAQTGVSTVSAQTVNVPAKPNGPVAVPTNGSAAAATIVTPISTASTSTSVSADDDAVEGHAVRLLVDAGVKSKGMTLNRKKLNSKMLAPMASSVAAADHAKVQKYWKDEAWFKEKAEDFGWTVNGEEVTFPAW